MGDLTLHGLACGYNGQRILNPLHVSFPPGALCALLGRNGSGKSTLLRTISGLLPAVSGSCSLNEQELPGMKVRQRAQRVAFLPQRPSMLEGVTVQEVLLMGLNPWLGLLSSPGQIQRDKALETGIQMGIGSLLDRDFSSLSEGQKQLVLLARAAVQNTPVMLMDEPDSALDYVNRHDMLRRLSALVHAAQKVCLLATHDPNFALAYCDRILILKDHDLKWDFCPGTTDRPTMEQALSSLYGEIVLIEQGGRRFMALK